MSERIAALTALLSRVEWLEGAPAREREALATRAVRRVLRAKQTLARRGEKLDVLAIVLSGALEVRRESESSAVAYRRLGAGEVVGLSTVAGAPHSADVVAVEETTLALLPGGEVRALLARHPDVALAVLAHLGGMVGALSDEVEQQRGQSIAERVALKLSQLGRGRREVRVTHQALADQVGASRENVSRALKALERRGLVRLRRGRIALLGP